MRQLFTIIILLFVSVSFGQSKDTLKPIVRKVVILHSPFGYIWQGTHNFDIGIQPSLLLNANNNHDNIGLIVSANITSINNSTYILPMSRIKLFKEIKNTKFGWEISTCYSFTHILKKVDQRITPEIGIIIRGFHLTYGYNIPLTNYTDKYTNLNRISLRYTGW